jgi:hypothetical protein
MVSFVDGLRPGDVVRPSYGELRRILDWADLVHVHGFVTWSSLLPELASKPVLVHYHGAPERGAGVHVPVPLLIATPDLAREYPEARFLPNFVLPEEVVARRPEHAALGIFRVFKSPSPHDKNREAFEVAASHARRVLGPRFRVVAPTDLLPHPVLQAVRATCDATFDHLHGYYGLESLEAMSQGIVAVNGCDEPCRIALRTFFGEDPPFERVRDERELGDRLIALGEMRLSTPSRFAALGHAARAFMERVWTPQRIASALLEVYREILSEKEVSRCA